MDRLLQCFKSPPAIHFLQRSKDDPDFAVKRMHVGRIVGRKPQYFLTYWRYSRITEGYRMSENHYAMSSECYQNLKPYLSTRTIPIPLHLWLYLTAVYDQFWVPCLDWPSLYPEQECIYDEEGLLRHDFGEKDVEFTTAQLRDAQELAGDHERAATEAVDDMREQVKGSQKREKHYDLALACFDLAKSRLDANLVALTAILQEYSRQRSSDVRIRD